MHLNFKYLLAIFSTEAIVFIFGGLLNKKRIRCGKLYFTEVNVIAVTPTVKMGHAQYGLSSHQGQS